MWLTRRSRASRVEVSGSGDRFGGLFLEYLAMLRSAERPGGTGCGLVRRATSDLECLECGIAVEETGTGTGVGGLGHSDKVCSLSSAGGEGNVTA